MSYGYGGRPNPYDQRDAGYGEPMRQPQGVYDPAPAYNGGRGRAYGQHATNPLYGGNDIEMAPLAHNASSMAADRPNYILNECREIDQRIDKVERYLDQVRMLQKRTLDDADTSSTSNTNRQLDALTTETMSTYRSLTERIRAMKSTPESRTSMNHPQVSRVERRLKSAIQQYQQVESQFRKRTQDQMARQYRIVRPDASEDEVQAAVEDTQGGQVFSQALIQSDRQGRARAALSAVQDRHAALVKIEQQMVELSQVFQDMDTLVVQQDDHVVQIEQKAEEVVENLDKGNEEIGVAVNMARKTRKKKWCCCGIVALIIIIVIVLLVYFLVIKSSDTATGNTRSRRDLSDQLAAALPVARALPDLTPRDAQSSIQAELPLGVAHRIARIARQKVRIPYPINQ